MKKLRQGGFLLAKVHQLSGRVFAKKLLEYEIDEINPAQGRILFALWQKDGVSIQELSKKTALGKSTLTRMLDRLESFGQLIREFPEDDRRKVIVRLTEKNRKMMSDYERVSEDMISLFYEGFTDKEIEGFEEKLKRIHENLAKYEEELMKGKNNNGKK